jgi:multiple sugar transport system ATP-binding protein
VQMRTEIKELHQRLRTTTVYVTHDQIEAMTMADKIVVMRDGMVEQIGSPLDLYDRPANMFVAGFIGSPSMNFLSGTVTPAGFETEDGIVLPMPAGTTAGAVTYGVRPEHIALVEGDGIAAELVVIEPTGAETQFVARLGGQTITGLVRDRMQQRPGDPVHIKPVAGAVHLFDRAGTRLAGSGQ